MTKLTPLQRRCLENILMWKWYYVRKPQVDALVKKGLVVKLPDDAPVGYQLTKEGIKLLAEG